MPVRAGAMIVAAALLAGAAPAAAGWRPDAATMPMPAAARPADDTPGDDFTRIPDDATLEERGAVIGEIVVRAGDVFDSADPAEDGALYRFANRLHRVTREQVIVDMLLFDSGTPYSRRLLDESERLLRSTRYLYDAQIRPIRYYGNRVDVEVTTRDVWTLTAGVGLSRSGGENTTRFQIQDTNFLGTGRDLAVERTSNVDRTSQLVKYRDTTLAGSRTSLEMWAADNSDGSFWRLDLERPFFSLDTDWAAGFFAIYDDRVDSIYDRGKIISRYRNQRSFAEVYAGRSSGLEGGKVSRWTAGFTYDASDFERDPSLTDQSSFLDGPRLPPPPDRTLVYPWVGFEAISDDFLETQDLDQIERTEDLFLGKSFRARLGWSSEAVTAERDEAIFDTAFRIGFVPGRARLLLLGGGAAGRWSESGIENLLAGISVRYYQRTFGRHLFFATVGADAARELDGDRQLLLGGDSGLRGYPLRYQEGDRRFLLTLEQRFYTDLHLFRLLHVGGAVFFDAGRAWFEDLSRPDDLGLLTDVGLGLRLSSSRSGQGSMIHLDAAFPLDGDGSIDSVQWLVTTKETF